MYDPLKLIGYLVVGLYLLTSLWLFLNALIQLHLLWLYKKRKPKGKDIQNLPLELPFVSIQVPVYNEKYVIERLLDSLTLLDYPKEKFEIQVLDDSTDETCAIIDQKAQVLRNEGIAMDVIRRGNRKEFKAGALAYGLPYCKGDLVAIFDADFTPPPGFLKSLVPYFSDPQIGLVQARWGHINKEENYLTRIQTFLLDTHFSIEQRGRSNAGYFINFCGTAGIWRKACIEDAGGWDGKVLSEDLDLSYRAQMKGWKLIYDEDIEVPAELPSVIEAFKIQQFRWTKGMAQMSRKNLKHLLQTDLPLGKKLHGVFHILSSVVFVCLFLNAILTVPLLVFRNLYPDIMLLSGYSAYTAINLVILTLFYYNGAQTGSKQTPVKFFTHYPLFLVVYMGLSVQNAFAVLQGYLGTTSVFVRTPKGGLQTTTNSSYLKRKINWINAMEVTVFCYFIYGIILSFYFHDYFMMLFFMMIGIGLGFIIYQSLQCINVKKILKPIFQVFS